MALATLYNLKPLLNIAPDNTAQDTLLTQCLAVAEEAVRGYCHRPGLVSPPVAYTAYLDGTGTDTARLPHYPVTLLTSISEDPGGYYGTSPNSFGTGSLLTEGTDFVLVRDDPSAVYLSLSGLLKRLRGGNLGTLYGGWPMLTYGTLAGGPAGPRWFKTPGSIKAVFTAGYTATAVPADLTGAVAQIAAWIKRFGPFGGLTAQSEHLGEYAYQLAQHALGTMPELGSSRQILAKYRERVL